MERSTLVDVVYAIGAVRHYARLGSTRPLCGTEAPGWQLRRVADSNVQIQRMLMRRPLCKSCDRMVRGDGSAA